MLKFIFLLLLLFPAFGFAQKSVLYNERRQLIVDTSFTVDEHTYQNLPKMESEILPLIYMSTHLPQHRAFEGVSGTVIVKIVFSKGECNFEIIRSKNYDFETAVYNACRAMKREYSQLAKKWKEEYSIYVPIKFETLPNKFDSLLKKNNSVTIQTPTFIEAGFADTTFTEDWIKTKTPNKNQ